MPIRTAAEARAWRAKLGGVTDALPDEAAAENVELYDVWRVGVAYEAGDRRRYGNRLYKAVQEHTSQVDWTPDVNPALWVVIDVSHAGTVDDPIPASRGMEYVYGLYYLDPEDGLVYLCTRTGEAEGGVIVLQYLPHELVGQYFTEA